MIFYFTGTGNSLAAAKAVLAEGEELINITDCVRSGKCSFTAAEGEKVGLVFPVYFGGIPSVVQAFLNHLELTGSTYTYAILTCGGMAANAGGMLEDRLAKKDIILDAVFPLTMPDNYAIMYDLDTEEKQAEILAKADEELADIKEMIAEEVMTTIDAGIAGKVMTRTMYPLYTYGRKTEKFYTLDTCVGCGLCASRCPYKAIVMENGRPVWVKDRCALCMACMRCGAICYNKGMEGRARYTHPDLKKKKHKHDHGNH